MTNISLTLGAERLRQSSWLEALRKAWQVLLDGAAHGLRPLLLGAALLPLLARDLPLFVHEPSKLHVIHLLILAASMSTLTWVLGERRLRRHGIEPRQAMCASPLDKPNTVLILLSDSRVRLTHLGVERDGLSCVFLHLDHPQELIQAVGNETQRR